MRDEDRADPPRRDRVERVGQAHVDDRPAAHRARARGRARRCGTGWRGASSRSCSPRRGSARCETAQLAGFEPRDRPRPGRDRLRRLRGPDDAGDPRGAAGLVAVGRRLARRRDAGRRGRARGPRDRRARWRRTATSRCSPTGTSCACSARAGSSSARSTARTSRSTPPRSASSATSARRGSSRTGTPEIHTVSTRSGLKLVRMKRWIIAALAVLVAVGLVTTATAAPGKKKAGAGAFRQGARDEARRAARQAGG